MALADEKYVSVATFRRSGEAVTTATWIVALDGSRFGFWTSSASGKAKRMRNNPSVTVQPSDGRGRAKPGSAVVKATAEIFTSGPDFDAIQSKVRAKYGVMVPISHFFGVLGHLGKGKFPYGDLGIVLTLDS